MPRALINKVRASSYFGRAFIVVEAQACAIADLALHTAGGPVLDPTAYAERMVRKLGLPSAVAMRHRIPQFAHVFGDEGYAARYYSYVWSEVIAHVECLIGHGPVGQHHRPAMAIVSPLCPSETGQAP